MLQRSTLLWQPIHHAQVGIEAHDPRTSLLRRRQQRQTDSERIREPGVLPTTSLLAARRRETLHQQAPERKFVRDGLPELGAQCFVHTMRYAKDMP